MIRVEGVSHRFGHAHVLRDVWFDVPAGEVLGFIGPNGAGKTTTLRMIATLLEPQIGRVLVDGIDVVDDPSAVRRVLGFMPDNFGVYERITVDEYLSFFAAAHGIERSARGRTVEAVMELTDLAQLRTKLVAALSKGMRQRLAIARTLIPDPKVLVLDEPANGLDPRARIEMRELIHQLRGMGKTIVLSSHILTELADIVTSVVILEKGRVVASGPLDRIADGVQQARIVRMRLLAYPEDVVAFFEALPGVTAAERLPEGELRITYEGGERVVADLVAEAVRANLPVVRVVPERGELEHIFLEVTKGEVQ
jgi:ABC-2 type transport system ATP-binding protein